MPITPEWVALSLVPMMGGKRMRALLDHFGSAGAVLHASRAELCEVSGIGKTIAGSITQIDLAAVERSLCTWQQGGLGVLAWDDPDYPARIKAIEDAPPTLFVWGDQAPCRVEKRRHVAIIGTREPSDDSMRTTRNLAFELAQRDTVIVSGLALGTDTNAHFGAIAAPDGVTLAVLGGGLWNIYPSQNRPLAEAVRKRGALIAETPPNGDPTPTHLVARNRLISALSDAVIVIETSSSGGAMHAARRAREQGKPVYALDLPASGNRMLIDEEGASVISAGTFEAL